MGSRLLCGEMMGARSVSYRHRHASRADSSRQTERFVVSAVSNSLGMDGLSAR